jgi:hypothetical protein
LTRALATGESVRIFQDGVDKGAATVSGTNWTFNATLATGSTSAFVAKVVNASGVLFETSNFSLTQSASGVTPLVLDLTDTGISTTTVQDGAQFDIDGDGDIDQTAWVNRGNGFLVMDLNEDGVINSGRELFGSGTLLKSGRTAKDGFEALADLDENQDGVIDEKDAAYARLQVWVDADGDATTDEGELRSLEEAGVSSIDLQAQAYDGIQNGNAQGLVSSFTTLNGESRKVVDVWLLTDSTDPALAKSTVTDPGLEESEVSVWMDINRDGVKDAAEVIGLDDFESMQALKELEITDLESLANLAIQVLDDQGQTFGSVDLQKLLASLETEATVTNTTLPVSVSVTQEAATVLELAISPSLLNELQMLSLQNS